MHSQINKTGSEDILLSWGVNQEGNSESIVRGMDFKQKLPLAFKHLGGPDQLGETVINYSNGKPSPISRKVLVNGVNLEKMQKYISGLSQQANAGKVDYMMTTFFPRVQNSMHCTIAASRALLHGGVFNIPFMRMPPLLDLQMRIRDYTWYSSFYKTTR